MIYESWPWKQDLQRRVRLLLKYNTREQFKKNEEAAYTVIEKSIFYSAFIIRKLIDCRSKVSDAVDDYIFHIESIKPLKHIDQFHNSLNEKSHDWENRHSVTVHGKDICNWLIHSFIFSVAFNEDGIISHFYVSSDYDKNKILYEISISDWLDYAKFVSTDYIVALLDRFDQKKGDYIFRYKERGKLE